MGGFFCPFAWSRAKHPPGNLITPDATLHGKLPSAYPQIIRVKKLAANTPATCQYFLQSDNKI